MSDQTSNPEPFGIGETGTSPAGGPTFSSDDRLWAGLSYFSQLIVPAVLPVILLLSEQTKKSVFVRYHAVHSLALLLASIVYELVIGVVVLIVTLIIPCLAAITWLLFLVPIAPFVYYGILALQGQNKEVPWLTQFLKNNHWA